MPRVATRELLAEIDAFLGKTGMTESAFGDGAVLNSAFVRSLRLDLPRLYERQVIRARRFIAENS